MELSDVTILHETKYLRLVQRGKWYFVERPNAKAVVIIVAITNAKEIVLVEQYRAAVNSKVVELPAGLVGDTRDNESIEEATRRELKEETGFEAEKIEILFSGPPSAGLSAEIVTFVKASNMVRTSKGGGDGDENIIVHLVPLDAVKSWLAKRQSAGAQIDPKVYAGLYWLEDGK